MLACALAVIAAPPLAAQPPVGTPAGTRIVNVAALRSGGRAEATESNPVTLIVAERLDCALTRMTATGGAAVVLLTNTGNGREAFAVTATGGDGASSPIFVDEAGDGRVDAARGRRLIDGVTPILEPGGSLRLSIPIDEASAPTMSARAMTGSGSPGQVLAGLGDGGGDAVVGPGGGAARLGIASAPAEPPTLTQTQAIVAGGDAVAHHGSVVRYTLVARFVSAIPAATIVDPVPAGTAYLPASLTLDDVAIADAGRLVDGRVVVALGAVVAGAVHRLAFKVVVQ